MVVPEPEEDEDVVFEGTALYEHLVQNGFELELEITNKAHRISENEKNLDEKKAEKELQNTRVNMQWMSDYKNLQNRFTIKILKSELLVLEDEEFMQNFIVVENNVNGCQTFNKLSSFLRILVPLSASALSCFLLKKFLETSWKVSTAAVSLSLVGFWSFHHHYRDRDHVKIGNMTRMLATMAELKDVVNKVNVLETIAGQIRKCIYKIFYPLQCLGFLRGMELVGKYYRQPTTFLTLRETLQKTSLSSLQALR